MLKCITFIVALYRNPFKGSIRITIRNEVPEGSSILAEVCSHYQVHGAKIEVIYNGRPLSSSSPGRTRIRDSRLGRRCFGSPSIPNASSISVFSRWSGGTGS